MLDTALVFWIVLDLFLTTLLLLVVVGGAVELHRAGPRQASRARHAPTRLSLTLYASGITVGLALPLAATLVQTFRALRVLPQHMSVATARWILPLLLVSVALCALSLTLGLLLDWWAERRSSAG